MVKRCWLYKFSIAVSPIIFLIQGCTQEDLASVKSLGPTVVDIKQYGTEVTQDFYESCVRGKEFFLRTAAVIEGSTDFIPVTVIRDCSQYREMSFFAKGLNGTLVTYMESLVKLASDQAVTFDESLGIAGASFSQLGGVFGVDISQSRIDESTGLVNSLLNVWSANFRRNSLRGIIVCTNDPLDNFVSLLNELVQDVYLDGVLDTEEIEIINNVEERYKSTRRETNFSQDTDAFVAFSRDLELEFETLMEAIISRQEKGQEYQQLLNLTIEAHQALTNVFSEDMSEVEIDALCADYFSMETKEKVNAAKSFREVTPEQFAKVKEILKRYSVDVENAVDN